MKVFKWARAQDEIRVSPPPPVVDRIAPEQGGVREDVIDLRVAPPPVVDLRDVAEIAPDPSPLQETEKEPRSARLRSALPILAILAVAAVFRLWHINALGFNSDEAVYAGQAAAIADDPSLNPFFPIFRAHPLLYQFLLAVVFQSGVSDLLARLLGVAFGLGTIVLVYKSASLLYDRRIGLIAAAFLAVMPYHVIVSRQALLDGPMVFFATLALYLLVRFSLEQKSRWLYATAAALGLTFLAKEIGIVLVPAVYAYLALSASIRVRLKELALSLGVFLTVVASFPLSLLLSGGTQTGKSYLVWQLFRRPNHDAGFYLSTVPLAIGIPVVLLAIGGLLIARHRTWRETLLVSWVIVPFLFFQAWPVKGFQYLLPVAVPVAILGALAIGGSIVAAIPRTVRWTALVLVVISLAVPAWVRVGNTNATEFLAGTGGVPGGREAGTWIKAHVPKGAQVLAIGPSMANIVQFYGHRKAYGLSVSPNPLHRNPSYEPVSNPDLMIRYNDLQYVVWDAYSAARSPFFANKLLAYADRYNGRTVHTQSVSVTTDEGRQIDKPVIVIKEVRP